MKKNIKGFTLIELLAVIVILGVIAVIAVPIVKNITKDAKMKSFMNSARGIIRAGDLYYSRKDMMDEISGDMIFEFPDNASELEVNGKLPETGKMIISQDGGIALAISNGKYCVTKVIDDKDVTITEDVANCKIVIPGTLSSLVTTSTEVTSVPACLNDGTECAPGTPVAIQVNANDVYNFYVISEADNEITLIMDRNIGNNVAWITAVDYTTANTDGTSCDYTACNDEGPLTALSALKERTSGWTNVPEKEYTISGLGIYESTEEQMYENITTTMRARMLTYTEATALGCTTNGGTSNCPSWLYINLGDIDDDGNIRYGYWFTTPGALFIDYAWGMSVYNSLAFSAIYDIGSGVRPVITLSK